MGAQFAPAGRLHHHDVGAEVPEELACLGAGQPVDSSSTRIPLTAFVSRAHLCTFVATRARLSGPRGTATAAVSDLAQRWGLLLSDGLSAQPLDGMEVAYHGTR